MLLNLNTEAGHTATGTAWWSGAVRQLRPRLPDPVEPGHGRAVGQRVLPGEQPDPSGGRPVVDGVVREEAVLEFQAVDAVAVERFAGRPAGASDVVARTTRAVTTVRVGRGYSRQTYVFVSTTWVSPRMAFDAEWRTS